MYKQGRERPTYKWLFGLAIMLTIVAVCYGIVVYVQHLSEAILTVVAVAAGCLWIYALLMRLEWRRSRVREDLTELVAAVERR